MSTAPIMSPTISFCAAWPSPPTGSPGALAINTTRMASASVKAYPRLASPNVHNQERMPDNETLKICACDPWLANGLFSKPCRFVDSTCCSTPGSKTLQLSRPTDWGHTACHCQRHLPRDPPYVQQPGTDTPNRNQLSDELARRDNSALQLGLDLSCCPAHKLQLQR